MKRYVNSYEIEPVPAKRAAAAVVTLRRTALRHAARRLGAAGEYPAASRLLVKISEGNRP